MLEPKQKKFQCQEFRYLGRNETESSDSRNYNCSKVVLTVWAITNYCNYYKHTIINQLKSNTCKTRNNKTKGNDCLSRCPGFIGHQSSSGHHHI